MDKKKPTAKPAQPRNDELAKRVLKSNYFTHRKRETKRPGNVKLTGRAQVDLKSPSKRRYNRFQQFLNRSWQRRQQKQQQKAVKKDQKIKKHASYLSTLPASRTKRLLHKLTPKRVLRFMFSWRGLFLFLKLATVAIVLLIAGIASLYLYYRRDVPASIASLQSCVEGQTTQYYDRTGRTLLWSSKSDVDCQPIQLADVSPYLTKALITIEDRSFYTHRGFHPGAVVRAAYSNLLRRKAQGGSTLTQQYIKNAILKDSRRTVDRKIKEIILAIELERTFEKEEILTAYLNTVSFGSIYNGIEAAAQGYFNKKASDLTPDEAALLVAALPAPTTFWNNTERHVKRQKWVLKQMYEAGDLSPKAYEEAVEVDILAKLNVSHRQYEDIRAPHFIIEAEKRLTEELCQTQRLVDEDENCDNIRLRGYKVITTLDITAQDLAEKAVNEVIPTIVDRGFDNAAITAVDVETGKVLAQVGSRDFEYPGFGQTNTVTQQRDPGSTVKPFDYGALMENSTSWGPGSIFYDYRTTFPDYQPEWTPNNYNGKHAGPITMRRAIGRSLNIPAVKAMHIAGIQQVHDFAYQAGIRTKFPCRGGCSLASAFGGGAELRLDELANAYATFSRGGVYLPLTYIDRVLDADGQLLRQWRSRPERVFKAETAYLMNHILADKSARYTQSFNLDPKVQTTMAVKTGTDDAFVNNHIVGYTKSVAVSAWFGHHDEATQFESEQHTTAPKALMIKTFMEPYHQNVTYDKKNHWTKPAGIQTYEIDLRTGFVVDADADATDRQTRKDVFPSWYQPQTAPEITTEAITVDLVSGRLATDCTPTRAQRRSPAIPISDELPLADKYYEIWQQAVLTGLAEQYEITGYTSQPDNVHQCDDDLPTIELADNSDQDCISVCILRFTVNQGTFPLKEVKITNDNQTVPGGTIPLDEDDTTQDLTFTYNPSALRTPTLNRGLLRLEVIDQGLYSAHVTVSLSINGQPPAPLPTAITLETAQLSGQTLTVSWNRAALAARLDFGLDCADLASVELAADATSHSFSIQPTIDTGVCSVFLVHADGQTDSIEFDWPALELEEISEDATES